MYPPLPTLPLELIMEILSWLPVKPLLQFRSVSKFWKSLIFDPSFAKIHLQRSPKNTHLLLTYGEVNFPVMTPYPVCHLLEHPSSTINKDECFSPKDDSYFALGSTNGLVCLISYKYKDHGTEEEIWVRLWNPTLRLRSKKSPSLSVMHPKCQWLQAQTKLGFGYDDSSDTYKVVALFWDHTTRKMEGRVHCVGDSCWRKILNCQIFPILLEETVNGAFLNGCVNWLALNNKLNCSEYEWKFFTIEQLVIFSLDLRTETCKYILLPDGLREVPQDEPILTVLRGRLCLYYDHLRTHFVFWEMREFGVQESWTRLVNVSYEHLQIVRQPLPVYLSDNGDVLLLATDNGVIMDNRRDDRVEHIQLQLVNKLWFANEHMQSFVLPRPSPH